LLELFVRRDRRVVWLEDFTEEEMVRVLPVTHSAPADPAQDL